jgi:predicted dehydrogenase
MKSHPPTIPRLALVGVSGYARIHLDLIREAEADGSAVLGAAVVINPEQEAAIIDTFERQGVAVYATFEAMLAAEMGRIDLCCIPTGISLHAPMTVAALHAGMNVLVEKPLAGSVAEADRIIAAEQETGRFVAVGFQDMYTDLVRWLKQQLLAGAIGQVEEIRFLGMWPRSTAYYARNEWAGKVASQGVPVMDSPLNNAFAHFPHLALFLAGTAWGEGAVASIVDGLLLRVHAIESFDTAVVRASTEPGVRFWFGVSHGCANDHNPEIRILGSSGTVYWKYEEYCRVCRVDGTVAEHPVYSAFEARSQMFRTVLQRLRDPSVFVVSPTLARAHTALVEQIHATLPIDTVPPAAVRGTPVAGAPDGHFVPVIEGIEDALVTAFATGANLEYLGGHQTTAGQPAAL